MTASERKQREVAQRRSQVLQLRGAGLTFEAIAQATGHKTAGAAVQDLHRALASRKKELTAAADLHLAMELERLLGHERQANQILRQANGSLLVPCPTCGDKVPVNDAAVALRALVVLLAISERRAQMLGLDSSHRLPGAPEAEGDFVDELAKARSERRGPAAAGR